MTRARNSPGRAETRKRAISSAKKFVEGVDYALHTVLPTDTLWGICLRYSVDPLRLRRVNVFSGSNLHFAPPTLLVPLRGDEAKDGGPAEEGSWLDRCRILDGTEEVERRIAALEAYLSGAELRRRRGRAGRSAVVEIELPTIGEYRAPSLPPEAPALLGCDDGVPLVPNANACRIVAAPPTWDGHRIRNNSHPTKDANILIARANKAVPAQVRMDVELSIIVH
uniref:LysM domain-containing protein n=1 Tax=Trieres chinensis TaxID=1514140 RepID=A0A7S2A3L4_TRICV|mmetsp:Transcript_38859/g.79237  ORF Transcript_38859/g.79237 Transcript_38859/m.79237 type:complete len:224 (+) Transcript_38859:169-840(+)